MLQMNFDIRSFDLLTDLDREEAVRLGCWEKVYVVHILVLHSLKLPLY
jgi:hypothetical protein